MTITLAADELLCQRFHLTPNEARAVIAAYGARAEIHCAAVAQRLAGELRLLTGARLAHHHQDIPALTLAKDEAIKHLMLTERPCRIPA